MPLSLQVLYPTEEDTTFDHGYYADQHKLLVVQFMGPYIEDILIVRGVAGGADLPAEFHAIATMTFEDQNKMDAAMAAAGPVLADISNFYSGQPKMLIGEVQN